MQGSQARKARIYDRLEGQEPQEPPRRRFAEVDTTAEAFRPGAVVALAFECDELLAVQRGPNGSSSWVLTTVCTEWSSRGSSGWHTHAGDYAVESLEPTCLFRVLRDGRHLALASVAATGLMLAATDNGDSLALVACNQGSWEGAGAAWERRDGGIFNCRWPEKSLAVNLLHITCLPTLQLQRVEEFYGGLLHEQHAEKATALRLVKEAEAERDVAAAEARSLRHRLEEQAQRLALAQERSPSPPQRLPELPEGPLAGDVSAQLAALQRQLEILVAGEGCLPQLQQQQERARMSICLRTIKEITDLVRQSAPPSSNGSGSPSVNHTEVTVGPHTGPSQASPDCAATGGYASNTRGESRLVDYLGSRPEEGDPLARVLGQPGDGMVQPDSPPRRVLRSLEENSLSSLGDADSCQQACSPEGLEDSRATGSTSAPGSTRKGTRRPPPLPLSDSLSAAVSQLAMGSPHTAAGVTQYLATGGNMRASQQRAAGVNRLRSSFLQRPPAAVEDLFYN